MKILSRHLATALVATLSLSPSAVSAQAPAGRPEPSAADKATARALLDEGDALLKAGDAQGAHDKYHSADAIMGVPTTSYALAEAQLRLSLLVEAADTLARIQRFPAQSGEPSAFTRARADAGRKLAELQKRIPSVTLKLDGAESNDAMRVTIDGAELAPSVRFLPRKVNPGKHEAAVDSGDWTGKASFELYEGDDKTVAIPMTRTGMTRNGEHTQGANVDAGIQQGPPIEAPRRVHPGVWVGVGVASASLVVGGITGGLTLSGASKLEDACPSRACTTPDSQDELEGARTLANVSTISFAVAGAAGGAALVTWLLTDSAAPPAKTTAVTPIFGPGYLGLRGSF